MVESMTHKPEYKRKFIQVSGGDRFSFLQGLVSNDVNHAKENLIYAAFLTPQGKYLADFFIFQRDNALILDVSAELAGPFIQRLSMYKLRADVTLQPLDMPLTRGVDAMPNGAFADPRHSSMGWRLYGEDMAEADIDWDHLRVEACIPESGIELIPNETYILEAGFERLNGVDFRKGCYVGQEVTARMKHKTQLRKGLVKAGITQPIPVGTPITSDENPIGMLYTQSGKHAIAYLRFDKATGVLKAGDALISMENM